MWSALINQAKVPKKLCSSAQRRKGNMLSLSSSWQCQGLHSLAQTESRKEMAEQYLPQDKGMDMETLSLGLEEESVLHKVTELSDGHHDAERVVTVPHLFDFAQSMLPGKPAGWEEQVPEAEAAKE